MKFQCDCCGKQYTIPQFDYMRDKKKTCECGEIPRRFKLLKLIIVEGKQGLPLFI